MDPNLTRTVSVLELLWAFVVVFGIIVHTINAIAAYGDWRRLVRSKTNTVRLLIATDSQRTELVLLVAQFAYAVAVTLAMLRPPPLRTLPFPINMAVHLFMLTELLLVWSSHKRRVTRQQVIQALEDRSK